LEAEEAVTVETGQTRTNLDKSEVLSASVSLQRSASGQTGQESGAIFTREDPDAGSMRTEEELEQLRRQADIWS
jgi:hypothetical protein